MLTSRVWALEFRGIMCMFIFCVVFVQKKPSYGLLKRLVNLATGP